MKKAIQFFIFSIPFFNLHLITNVSLADLGMLILIISIMFSSKKSLFDIKSYAVIFFYCLFLWSICSLFILEFFVGASYFDYLGFFKNSLRFLTVLYLFKYSKSLFQSHKKIRLIYNTWARTLKLICIIGFVELFFNFLGISTILSHSNESSRISSVFSEPSYFCIYINFSLIILFELNKRFNISSKKQVTKLFYFVVVSLLISKSLTGYFLFLIICYVYKENIFNKRLRNYRFFSSIIIGLLISGTFYINYERLNNIRLQNDGSANHRLLGSIELMSIINNNYLFTGTGLGQQRNFLDNSDLDLKNHYYKHELKTGSGINNTLLLYHFQLGLIGLVLILLILYTVFKKNKKLLIFIILSCFTWGFMFNPLFWFSISILNVLFNGKQKNIIYIN